MDIPSNNEASSIFVHQIHHATNGLLHLGVAMSKAMEFQQLRLHVLFPC